MKKSLLLIFLASIVLAGCSTTPTVAPVTTGINTNTISNDELFQKKQECAGYYNQVLDETKNNRGDRREFTIDEIFYSPTRNSCIGVISLYTDTPDGYTFVDSRIYDILNKNRESTKTVCRGLTGCSKFDNDETVINNEKRFDDKLIQLKGE